jgi:hypothetical protein
MAFYVLFQPQSFINHYNNSELLLTPGLPFLTFLFLHRILKFTTVLRQLSFKSMPQFVDLPPLFGQSPAGKFGWFRFPDL